MSNEKIDMTILRLHLCRDIHLEDLNHFVHGINTQATRSRKDIERREREIEDSEDPSIDKSFLLDQLSDDFEFMDQAELIGHELSIIALYKKVEISIRRAISIAFPEIDSQQLHKIKELKKALKNKGIDITSINDFPLMNEARCINNDIKHSGRVGKELAEHPEWNLNDPLNNLDKAYQRLAPGCERYVSDLVGELIYLKSQSFNLNS